VQVRILIICIVRIRFLKHGLLVQVILAVKQEVRFTN